MTPGLISIDTVEASVRSTHRAGEAAVSLRPFPYPYKAALAVCSDLDETPTADDYFEMVRLLNTTAPTRFGPGLGLEVGNSMYFDMPPDQFSYWNAGEAARARVRALMQSGHVDCLHSFGDLATTRAHAARALDELERHGCPLKVWVDHAVAPTNFGADIMRGRGDVEGAAAYHADLTFAFGIEYVWRGRVTSVLGQDAPRRLRGIGRRSHPVSSTVTILKEAAKGALARAGSRKYRPHAGNQLTWSARLRSGQEVCEFMRANPSWGGVSRHETADGFGDVVDSPMLRRLAAKGAACVLYTHLGKLRTRDAPLGAAARRGFDDLAAAYHSGDVLVTTTRRLLEFTRARREVVWSVAEEEGATTIRIVTAMRRTAADRSASCLDGLSFYVDDVARSRAFVDGRLLRSLQRNPPDHTGRSSVSIPWPRLVLPV